MVYSKHYTLEEAGALLREIVPILVQMAGLKEELTTKGYDIYRHQYFGGSGPNGQKFFPRELEELVVLVRRISELGVELKDIDKGLIDFPHIRKNGDEVFLCYMLGEPGIVSWHSLEGGFAGRRPLEEL